MHTLRSSWKSGRRWSPRRQSASRTASKSRPGTEHMRSVQASEDGSGVRVRAAGAPDLPAIAEFQTACWREAYRGVVPQEYLDRITVADRGARWRERLVSGARHVAVAELGESVVGVASWGLSDVTDVAALELM